MNGGSRAGAVQSSQDLPGGWTAVRNDEMK